MSSNGIAYPVIDAQKRAVYSSSDKIKTLIDGFNYHVSSALLTIVFSPHNFMSRPTYLIVPAPRLK
jgi:hypothetical protein